LTFHDAWERAKADKLSKMASTRLGAADQERLAGVFANIPADTRLHLWLLDDDPIVIELQELDAERPTPGRPRLAVRAGAPGPAKAKDVVIGCGIALAIGLAIGGAVLLLRAC
jgi:hypothetical protein